MDRLQKEIHSTAVNGETLGSYQWVGASETPACAVNTSSLCNRGILMAL